MKTYLLTYPGWDAGGTAAGKLWLRDGTVLACESTQDYAVRRAAAAVNGNLLRCCTTTWAGMDRIAMEHVQREPWQEPVEKLLLPEDWQPEHKPQKPTNDVDPATVEIATRNLAEQPFGRTVRCGRGCGPYVLTEAEVAALPYHDDETWFESPVCRACKKRKHEIALEKKNGKKPSTNVVDLMAEIARLQEALREIGVEV